MVRPVRASRATSTSTSSRSSTPAARLLGAGVTFLDTTAAKRIADEHERSTRELETAYEELQSTNEELETTNEELQSTVEELETTNEELQSTNEELETMNEELQSTNEELETVNEELRERSEELKRVNTFLESILAQPARRGRGRRPRLPRADLEPEGGGPLGPAARRGPRQEPARTSTSACRSSGSSRLLLGCLAGEAALPGGRARRRSTAAASRSTAASPARR